MESISADLGILFARVGGTREACLITSLQILQNDEKITHARLTMQWCSECSCFALVAGSLLAAAGSGWFADLLALHLSDRLVGSLACCVGAV